MLHSYLTSPLIFCSAISRALMISFFFFDIFKEKKFAFKKATPVFPQLYRSISLMNKWKKFKPEVQYLFEMLNKNIFGRV